MPASEVPPFDQVRDAILAEVKRDYINGRKMTVLNGIAFLRALRRGAADVGRGAGDEGNSILKRFHIRPIV